jgi:hypothetical protein
VDVHHRSRSSAKHLVSTSVCRPDALLHELSLPASRLPIPRFVLLRLNRAAEFSESGDEQSANLLLPDLLATLHHDNRVS